LIWCSSDESSDCACFVLPVARTNGSTVREPIGAACKLASLETPSDKSAAEVIA